MAKRICGFRAKNITNVWSVASLVLFSFFALILCVNLGTYYPYRSDTSLNKTEKLDSTYLVLLYKHIDNIEALQLALFISEDFVVIALILILLGNNYYYNSKLIVPFLLLGPLNAVVYICLGTYIVASINEFYRGDVTYNNKFEEGFEGIGISTIIAKTVLIGCTMYCAVIRYISLSKIDRKKKKKKRRDSFSDMMSNSKPPLMMMPISAGNYPMVYPGSYGNPATIYGNPAATYGNPAATYNTMTLDRGTLKMAAGQNTGGYGTYSPYYPSMAYGTVSLPKVHKY